MNVGVVGGGVLGLALAWRLARLGHAVDVVEAAPALGGLAGSAEYGEFVWDRFYHCILPQDRALLAWLGELDLADDLRWKTTSTGYYARGKLYTMSSTADFLRFPLLSLLDKARLGAAVVYATRVADPRALQTVTAERWLTTICGRHAYEVFWRPLLRAKFGVFHDRVAAVFIWATLARLMGARSGTARKECLGYVHGGYGKILDRARQRLTKLGVGIRLGARVTAVRPDGRGCAVATRTRDGRDAQHRYDQVFFTAPTRVARAVAAPEFHAHIDRVDGEHPDGRTYLGVVCPVLVLKRPLTPYYVLNLGDERVEMTGVIEMTNLIDPREETNGRSLVYLPRYLDSDDPQLEQRDEAVLRAALENGLRRAFPAFREDDIVHAAVHRARYVQPLPLVRAEAAAARAPLTLRRPFQVLNTSMLRCATLNNNEVVNLADEFVRENLAPLARDPVAAASPQAFRS